MQNMQIMYESDRPLKIIIFALTFAHSNIFRRNYDIVLDDAL